MRFIVLDTRGDEETHFYGLEMLTRVTLITMSMSLLIYVGIW